MGANKLH